MKMIIQAAKAVVGNELIENFWIETHNGVITKAEQGINQKATSKTENVLIPGFIDIHCHGAAGFYFSDQNESNIKKVITAHNSRGTTGLMASLVTEPLDELKKQILRLLPFYLDGSIIGIHLEGPYLSHAKCGAHDPNLLRVPNIEELVELIDIGGESIKMVTIAPELPGAIETIKYLIQKGIKPALGHSDANSDQFQKGFTAGANLITHFTNAMRKERGSGTVYDLILNQENVAIELILDGQHVNYENAKEIIKNMTSQTILITDAMSATGQPDGNYKIGKKDVVVKEAVARLVDGNNLAGSTLTMEQAFKNAVDVCNLNLVEAVHVSSTNAAKALGLLDRGQIKVGMRADLLTYNENNKEISRLDNI